MDWASSTVGARGRTSGVMICVICVQDVVFQLKGTHLSTCVQLVMMPGCTSAPCIPFQPMRALRSSCHLGATPCSCSITYACCHMLSIHDKGHRVVVGVNPMPSPCICCPQVGCTPLGDLLRLLGAMADGRDARVQCAHPFLRARPKHPASDPTSE